MSVTLSCLDGSVVFLAVAITGVVAAGMWTSTLGSGLPLQMWFGWHPVLMTLAFLGCMTLGMWMHKSAGPGDEGRRAHAILMGTAVVIMIPGYLAVLIPHLPRGQAFGYDFKRGAWKEWRRVLHACLGHALVAAALLQALAGLAKLRALGLGRRTLRFHGRLGRWLLGLAAANLALGAWLSAWAAALRLLAPALAALCLLAAAAAGRAPGPWRALPPAGGRAAEGAAPPAAEAVGRAEE